jgi:hypothetical protein
MLISYYTIVQTDTYHLDVYDVLVRPHPNYVSVKSNVLAIPGLVVRGEW